jgi:hypothetical protein
MEVVEAIRILINKHLIKGLETSMIMSLTVMVVLDRITLPMMLKESPNMAVEQEVHLKNQPLVV